MAYRNSCAKAEAFFPPKVLSNPESETFAIGTEISFYLLQLTAKP
jgi:hypothetical protein